MVAKNTMGAVAKDIPAGLANAIKLGPKGIAGVAKYRTIRGVREAKKAYSTFD